jgi:ABC-type Fe3+/spermidine/putrescine transport system ATPase subunit
MSQAAGSAFPDGGTGGTVCGRCAARGDCHEVSLIPALEIRNLVKSFADGNVIAVDDVSLAVAPGEILSILGPSGCGKTTIMRIMAGLERADAGDVLLEGRSVLGVPPHKRNVGLVFQDLAIFPHKTVRENVAFGLRMKGVKGADIGRRVDEALRLVELPPATFARRMPNELSGGQRQRVAVARTIVVEPAVILFDEPMAALDRRLRDRMAIELRRIQKQLNLAAIYVTHDQETASMMSDRIAVMLHGRLMQLGTPLEVYRAPANRFVADFIGDMSFVAATVSGAENGRTRLDVFGNPLDLASDLVPAAREVTLGLRPEHVRLEPEKTVDAIVRGQLKSTYFSGGSFVHRLLLPDGTELVARSEKAAFQPGQELWVAAAPEDIRVLAS